MAMRLSVPCEEKKKLKNSILKDLSFLKHKTFNSYIFYLHPVQILLHNPNRKKNTDILVEESIVYISTVID